jgi:integration host factor subunit beta
MATITKKELVNRIAERTGQTKVAAKDVVQMFLDEMVRELGDGNRLEFREFGVFEVKRRARRKAQNPRTGQSVEVPSRYVVKFKAGRGMKAAVDRLAAADVARRAAEKAAASPPSSPPPQASGGAPNRPPR